MQRGGRRRRRRLMQKRSDRPVRKPQHEAASGGTRHQPTARASRGTGSNRERPNPATLLGTVSSGACRTSAEASTAMTVPSGAGNMMRDLRGTGQRLLDAVTVRVRPARYPEPLPSPDHSGSLTRSVASACGHAPCTNNTAPRSRSRAPKRATSASITRPGGRIATTGNTSATAAATASQRGPGSGTSTSRSSATPSRSAASAPNSGMPITPHQVPSCEGRAISANSNDIEGGSE